MQVYRPTYTRVGTAKGEDVLGTLRHRGKRQFVRTGMRDRAAALVRAAEIVKHAELRAAGVETHRETREIRITPLLKEYHDDLLRRGLAERYADDAQRQLSRLLIGVETVSELTPERVRRLLQRVATRRTGRESAVGPHTAPPAGRPPRVPRRRSGSASPFGLRTTTAVLSTRCSRGLCVKAGGLRTRYRP